VTYIFPGPITKLDPFTLRMMEDVLKDHATKDEHERDFCCEVAEQYKIRVESHYSIVADEKASRGTEEPVERPLSTPQRTYIAGLARKCPQHLLSPQMREQVAKVLKHEEISYEAASAIIDCMKAVVDGPSVPQQRSTGSSVRPATPAQIGFLRKLLAQREHDEQVDIERLEELPFKQASEMISRLKSAPYKAEPKTARYIPEDGFYCVEGTYYKVVTSERTGHPSARMWDSGAERWEYVGQRPFKFLTKDHALTAEDAARFGELFHRCVFCTQQLTREESEAVGYGKDCAEKRGLPWG
jgi:hypothetical protein